MDIKAASAAAVAPTCYKVADLQVDVGRRSVTRAETDLAISGMAFDLFVALIRAAPNLVSIDKLMERVWAGLVVSTETVSQRVKVLRRALGDDADQPRYIASVRGHGYRIVAPVAPLTLPEQADLMPLPTGASSMPVKPAAASEISPFGWSMAVQSKRRWTIAAAILLALLGMSFLTQGLWRKPAAIAAAPSPTTQSTTVGPPGSVAVLPFANLTGDPSKDYLGDGMAQELINTLTKVPGLTIPARTSSFAYKGRNTDIRQIAKDLGVRTILEGSVRSGGERLRITAELIDAQSGLHLWSESYDEPFADLFKLQDKLANAIARQINPGESTRANAAMARIPPTADVEAYQLYLQGWALADLETEQSEMRAIKYFEQALTRDPNLAGAYDGIANAHMALAATLNLRPSEHIAAAERAAQRALALDSSIADAHNILAGTKLMHGNAVEMEAHGRAALALGGNDGYIHVIRALNLSAVGHIRAALDEGRKAVELAPAHPFVVATFALFNTLSGRNAEALKYAAVATDLGYPRGSEPLATIYASAAFGAGRYAEAANTMVNALDTSDRDQARMAEVIKVVFTALANPVERSNALAVAHNLYPQSASTNPDYVTNAGPCVESSYMYSLIGALDAAYEMVNRCLDRMAPGAVYGGRSINHLWASELRPFRSDARFSAFITRLGLMDYYKQYGPPDDCDLRDGKLTCH